ncbi:MAG: hypothetical protein OEV21_05495 [Thermoplasmata archaeon]|nr:hypothetical protein [Thermoplasmata archaeon]
MQEKSEALGETLELLRKNYSGFPKDQNENAMIAVASLIAHSMDSDSPEKIAKETLTVIHRLFDFQYVYIALKDKDGFFRYVAQIGLPKDKEKVLFQIMYSKDDVFDEATYPSTPLSDITRFYMSESMPFKENELDTFGRPIMIGQRRMSPDEMMEADYFDIYIRDWNQDPIGYIEMSLTRSRKLPDRMTIAWLELIATVIGPIISKKD